MFHNKQISDEKTRNAFSLVEVIVVMGISGLLLAILIPAVQKVRATARNTSCKNHLHQIGIAMHQLADVEGEFPTSQNCFVDMLPYFGESNLQNILNAKTTPPTGFSPPALPWIQCPADSYIDSSFPTPSYVVNEGTRLLGSLKESNGMRKDSTQNISPAEVSDGLSQTAAFAESLFPPPSSDTSGASIKNDEKRYFWHTLNTYSQGEEAAFADACRNHRTASTRSFGFGAVFPARGYMHLLPPNSPGCFNGPDSFQLNLSETLRTTVSDHAGGVNVLFADGSVHFHSSSIAGDIWAALGTRNGNESIGHF